MPKKTSRSVDKHALARIHRKLSLIAKSRGGRLISSSYKNSKTKVEWQCEKGHSWSALPNKIRVGQWCPFCAGKRKTIEEMKKLAASKGGHCLSTAYLGVDSKLRWKCACGNIWETIPTVIIRGGWCPKCSKKGKYSNLNKERLIREIVAFFGRVPTRRELDSSKKFPSHTTIKKLFSMPYREIFKSHGFYLEKANRNRFSDEFIKDEICRIIALPPRGIINLRKWKKYSRISYVTLSSRRKLKIIDLYRIAGVDPAVVPGKIKYSKEDCINSLRAYVSKYGVIPQRRDLKSTPGMPTNSAITRHFGSYNKFIISQGFKPNANRYGKLWSSWENFIYEVLSSRYKNKSILRQYYLSSGGIVDFYIPHLRKGIDAKTSNYYLPGVTDKQIKRFLRANEISNLEIWCIQKTQGGKLRRDVKYKFGKDILKFSERDMFENRLEDYINKSDKLSSELGFLTKEALIEKIKIYARELGRAPTQREINRDPRFPSSNSVMRIFGSYYKALQASGLESQRTRFARLSNEQLLNAFKVAVLNYTKAHNQVPTIKQYMSLPRETRPPLSLLNSRLKLTYLVALRRLSIERFIKYKLISKKEVAKKLIEFNRLNRRSPVYSELKKLGISKRNLEVTFKTLKLASKELGFVGFGVAPTRQKLIKKLKTLLKGSRDENLTIKVITESGIKRSWIIKRFKNYGTAIKASKSKK